jgi:hypothetical protein
MRERGALFVRPRAAADVQSDQFQHGLLIEERPYEAVDLPV